MNDRPPRQSPGASKKFLPKVHRLESRLLLSRQVLFPDGSSQFFPVTARLPRTGGVAIQSGMALTIGVGQPRGNTVQITLDGEGDVHPEWNGGPVHSFTGVQATLVQTERTRNNVVTFNLTTPRTSPTSLASGLLATTSAVSAKSPADPVQAVRSSRTRTSGAAFQSGSVLTVTVTAPRGNSVELSSLNFGQVVQVEWNGGPVHDFSGVSTIVVVTKTGQQDLIALDTAVAKGP